MKSRYPKGILLCKIMSQDQIVNIIGIKRKVGLFLERLSLFPSLEKISRIDILIFLTVVVKPSNGLFLTLTKS